MIIREVLIHLCRNFDVCRLPCFCIAPNSIYYPNLCTTFITAESEQFSWSLTVWVTNNTKRGKVKSSIKSKKAWLYCLTLMFFWTLFYHYWPTEARKQNFNLLATATVAAQNKQAILNIAPTNYFVRIKYFGYLPKHLWSSWKEPRQIVDFLLHALKDANFVRSTKTCGSPLNSPLCASGGKHGR